MQYEEQEKEGMWQIWRTVLMFNKKWKFGYQLTLPYPKTFLTDQS